MAGELAPLLDDPACVAFVKRVGACAALTTARDPLTHALLGRLGVEHELLPCPAFHAARRVNGGRPVPSRDVLAVNLMEPAGTTSSSPRRTTRAAGVT